MNVWNILGNILGIGLFLSILVAILLLAGVEALPHLLAGDGSGSFFALAVPVAFITYAVYTVVRRGMEMRAFAREGVPAMARIVQKRSYPRGPLKYWLRYEYRDSLGRLHRGQGFVSEDLWRSSDVGSSLEVVYLPRRPNVAALRSDVELARTGLPLE